MAEIIFETLIPVRNSADESIRTVELLAVQADNGFSVLISGCFSTSVQEYVACSSLHLHC